MKWRIINDRREIIRPTCDKRASKEPAILLAKTFELELKTAKVIAWEATAREMLQSLKQLSSSQQLPQRWVLKPNNSTGRALLVEGDPDWDALESALNSWSRPSSFEGLHWMWGYAIAKSGFIVEEWIGSEGVPPIELSAWMIHGKAEFFTLQRWEKEGLQRNHYNAKWEEVPSWNTVPGGHLDITAPPTFIKEVLPFFSALSVGWDLVRVDLYFEHGHVWLSEIIPYPTDGLLKRRGVGPEMFDQTVGALWHLPSLESVREGNP